MRRRRYEYIPLTSALPAPARKAWSHLDPLLRRWKQMGRPNPPSLPTLLTRLAAYGEAKHWKCELCPSPSTHIHLRQPKGSLSIRNIRLVCRGCLKMVATSGQRYGWKQYIKPGTFASYNFLELIRRKKPREPEPKVGIKSGSGGGAMAHFAPASIVEAVAHETNTVSTNVSRPEPQVDQSQNPLIQPFDPPPDPDPFAWVPEELEMVEKWGKWPPDPRLYWVPCEPGSTLERLKQFMTPPDQVDPRLTMEGV